MKYRKLHINFFDTNLVTDEKPFFHTCTVPYQEVRIVEELGLDGTKTSFEINNEIIDIENINVEINSKYYDNSFSIQLSANNVMSYVCFNTEGTTFAGTLMLNKEVGFHYALIE